MFTQNYARGIRPVIQWYMQREMIVGIGYRTNQNKICSSVKRVVAYN